MATQTAEARTARHPARVAGMAAIGVTAVLLLLMWGITVAQRGLNGSACGVDFGHVLTGARIIRDGQGHLLYDSATQQATQARVLDPCLARDAWLPYDHPPVEALAIAPLIDLPYAVAFGVWTLAAVLAVGLAAWLLARAFPLPAAVRWPLLGAIATYPFLHSALWLGQDTPFVLLGVCGLVAALRQERIGWASLSLALVALKPQFLPVLLLLLVLQRRWRTLVIAFGTLAAASVAVMPWLGPAWPLQFLRLLAHIASGGQAESTYPAIMPNWRGLAINLVGSGAPGMAVALAIILIAASHGWLVRCWWRARADRGAEPALWGTAIVVALLAAPHANPHELTLMIVPAWIVLATAPPAGPARRWLVLLWALYGSRWLAFLPGYPAVAVVPTVLLLAAMALLLGRACLAPGRARPARATVAGDEGVPVVAI